MSTEYEQTAVEVAQEMSANDDLDPATVYIGPESRVVEVIAGEGVWVTAQVFIPHARIVGDKAGGAS